MLKITNYSCYDDYTVTSKTENVSNVVDKLIRLTAKITERFASDIYYDINSFLNCVEQQEPYDRVLFFSETGVWTVGTDELIKIDCIQSWRLTYDPEETTTTLVRVDVRKESV